MCHAVVIDPDSGLYQGASPDEVALVQGIYFETSFHCLVETYTHTCGVCDFTLSVDAFDDTDTKMH